MWQRIASLFTRRPVEAPTAPARDGINRGKLDNLGQTKAPQHTEGEGPATAPAVPLRMQAGVPREAVALSKAFEGFSPTSYLCQGGVWTIGYGSTRWANGKPVVKGEGPITEEAAARMAEADLAEAARQLALDFPGGLPVRWWAVGVLMNNNLGRMRAWGPTLHRMLSEGRWRDAAHQLRHYRNADGRPSLGLRRRRWAEAAFALGMEADAARAKAWAEIETADDWPPLP